MNIFKLFDFLTKVGYLFAIIGELLKGFGTVPPPSNLEDEEEPPEPDR